MRPRPYNRYSYTSAKDVPCGDCLEFGAMNSRSVQGRSIGTVTLLARKLVGVPTPSAARSRCDGFRRVLWGPGEVHR
jgi:hypothetical protein